jgi:CO/xanthine dehydrogenase Mo-binding subunit
LSLFYHGAGFTGSGEVTLASRAALETTPGGVRILVANTEIGQGTRTMLAQIVADALGVQYDTVEVAEPDTSRVPDSGPTVASRTCMVVGGLLERCAHALRAQIGAVSPAEHHARHGVLRVEEQYEPPSGRSWSEETYRGDAYATFAWGCDVAEVEVDPVTSEARVHKLTAVQEFGRPIHPALARGQIEGGTAQALGWALLEHVAMRDGAMANAQLTNYTIPTTLDTPAMDIVMLENPYAGGPFGAKGLGELPIDGPAPAVVNAIRHAGLDVRAIPATPEVLMACARLADGDARGAA